MACCCLYFVRVFFCHYVQSSIFLPRVLHMQSIHHILLRCLMYLVHIACVVLQLLRQESFLPAKLAVHLRFFCGPDAVKSAALAKQQKKKGQQQRQRQQEAAAAEEEDKDRGVPAGGAGRGRDRG